MQRLALGVDGREEGLEDRGGEGLKALRHFGLFGGIWGGKVVHDQQRWGLVVLATTSWALHRSLDILAQRIVLDLEVKGRSTRSNSQSHIRVAGCGLGEQHKVGDTKRSSHDGIISQSVGFALLYILLDTA